MNTKFKKLISGVLSAVMTLTATSMITVASADTTMGTYEENLGLTKVNPRAEKNKNILDTVEYSPEQYVFTYGGREFTLADTETKNGKTTFFVVANEAYGKRVWHTNADKKHAAWDIDDTECIAYWLNHDFLTNGNSGLKIPEDMQSYIDTEHIWHTEPLGTGGASTVDDKYYSELQTKHGVAIVSDWELAKYANIIGWFYKGSALGNYHLRGSRTSSVQMVAYSTTLGQSGDTSKIQKDERAVRPCFYLKSDFFQNYKIENIGSSVASAIAPYCSEDLYGDEEIFAAPTASDVRISGEAEIGKTLTLTYTYNCGVDEGDTVIAWYESASENGTYSQIRGEKSNTLLITDDLGGKYIKATVTPKSVSPINTVGEEVTSNVMCIFEDGAIADALDKVKKASDSEVYGVLSANNNIFGIDLSAMASLSDDNKSIAGAAIKAETFENVEQLTNAYNKAIAIAAIAAATEATSVASLLTSEALGLDLTFYNSITDEQKATVCGYIAENDIKTFATLQTVVNQQSVLVYLNAQTSKSTIRPMLLAAEDILSATLSDLGSYQMGLVTKAVLDAEAFATFAELDKLVKNESVKARSVSVTTLGLVKSGRQATALSGAVSETPVGNLFKVDNQEFIVLDSAEKNGKTYYFILTEDFYGQHPFRTSGTESNWDPDDTGNMAYWLNNDFYNNGNGGYALPESFKPYYDNDHIWNTEPVDTLTGYDTEQVTSHPLALMSSYEWKKYLTEFGTGDVAYWWLRTSRSGDLSGTSKTATMLVPGTAAGTGVQQGAGTTATSPYVRPCFWLSEDFFREVPIQSAGANVAVKIDKLLDASVYDSEEAIKNVIEGPKAKNVTVSGEIVAGQKLTVSYDYESGFGENGTTFAWYQSSSEDGTYSLISGQTGNELVLTDAMANKYIKAGVSPKSTSVSNPDGDEVMSNAVGKIYGSSQASSIVSNVNGATAGNVVSVIESNNELFGVDTGAISNFDELGKANVGTIISNSNVTSVDDVREVYNKAIVIETINETRDKTAIDEFLKDESLGLDTTRYEQLTSNSNVIDNIYKKEFNSVDAFETAFYQSVAVTDIAQSDRLTIIDALKGNNGVFTTDLSVYSDEQLETVATTILTGTYATFAELDSAITTAASNIKITTTATPTPTKSPSSGGSGGSGGGGGSSVSSASTAVANRVNTPTIETEDKEVVATPAPTKVFNDIDEAGWAEESVTYLKGKNIVSGDDDGNFRPNDNITREEFTKLVVSAFYGSEKATGELPFTDIAYGAWYSEYVDIAYAKGIIGGLDDTTFGVGRNITRQDMAAILYRIIADTENDEELEEVVFDDDDSVADYAKEAVRYMASKGIINGMGDNLFAPTQNATRAQAARILFSVLNAQ